MTNSTTEKLTALLKPIVLHGDFDNILPVFDIYDEINTYSSKGKKYQEYEQTNGKTEDRKSSGDRGTSKSNEELIDLAYQFRNEDEILTLIKETLKEIRYFEKVLYDSDEILEEKFNSKDYQL